MSHELVIRGGNVVDGLGGEPRRADVAIDDGKISAVGKVEDKANREFDADGLTVTPGFVDMHTHLDAQLGWDQDVTPLSWHGVTTALIGNCGVTFAPCKPEDRALLAGMMETVEDIPRESIMEGLPWDWVDYGEYLDSLERLQPGINIAGMIGHAALRFFVMGERAVEEQSTDEERVQMAKIVAEALDCGAVGFSSNRFAGHKLPDGRAVPGTYADVEELELIGYEVGQRNKLFQSVGMSFEHMEYVADRCGTRHLFNSTLHPAISARDDGYKQRERVRKLADGRDVSGVAQVRGSGALLGFNALLPFRGESWHKLRKLSPEGMVEAVKDARFYDHLIAEAKEEGAGWADPARLFSLGDGETPDHTMGDHNRLSSLAQAAGEHHSETFLRLQQESNGRMLFNYVGENRDLDALRDLFDGGPVYPGVGDAGAHVSMVMDAGWATFVLSHWIREEGLFSMGEGIRRLTSAPARIVGLTDRGALVPGKRADITVFDADRVAESYPFRVTDFPAGAPRLTQRAVGYKAILVNGDFNVVDDELTGNHAGTVIR
jgi:N-acyl-D-aspartate/D-glutamate deacylase